MSRWGGVFDVFLDVHGDYSFGAVRGLLRPTGRFVGVKPGLGLIVQSQLSKRFGKGRARLVLVKSNRAELDAVRGWIEAGRLRAHIDASYPLEAAHEAHRRSETGHTRGKIALTVSANA